MGKIDIWRDKEDDIKRDIISNIKDTLVIGCTVSLDTNITYEELDYAVNMKACAICLDGNVLTIETEDDKLIGDDVGMLTIESLISIYHDIKNCNLYLTITAHIVDEPCEDDSMVLHYRTIPASDRGDILDEQSPKPFFDYLMQAFPLFKWLPDDGEDEFYTTYIQYVAYTEGKVGGNYVLANLEYLPKCK